ncbi:MAG TPA: hypothetical protein VLT62_07000 [Candidatus Methylomirabilis sp.]|nr:hypothetical protein [Candidatus Methylomirabilis sp.]
MTKGYDFSKGARGKFYKPGIQFRMPVYLDKDAFAYVQRIARRKKSDISTVVNELILTDKRLAEVID